MLTLESRACLALTFFILIFLSPTKTIELFCAGHWTEQGLKLVNESIIDKPLIYFATKFVKLQLEVLITTSNH